MFENAIRQVTAPAWPLYQLMWAEIEVLPSVVRGALHLYLLSLMEVKGYNIEEPHVSSPESGQSGLKNWAVFVCWPVIFTLHTTHRVAPADSFCFIFSFTQALGKKRLQSIF